MYSIVDGTIDDIIQKVSGYKTRIMVLILVLCLLTALLIILPVWRINEIRQAIYHGMKSVTDGHYRFQVRDHLKQTKSVLLNQFNQMTQSLKTHEDDKVEITGIVKDFKGSDKKIFVEFR